MRIESSTNSSVSYVILNNEGVLGKGGFSKLRLIASVKEENVLSLITGRSTGEYVVNSAVNKLNRSIKNDEGLVYGNDIFYAFLNRGIGLERNLNSIGSKVEIAALGISDNLHVIKLGLNTDLCATRNVTNNGNNERVDRLLELNVKSIGNLKLLDLVVIGNICANSIEVNVVDVHGGGSLIPAVKCTFSALLEAELNLIYAGIQLNTLEGKLVVDTVKRSIAFPRTAALKYNRVGNLNYSAVNGKVKNSIDLKRLHGVITLSAHEIAVTAAHGDVTNNACSSVNNKSKRSLFTLSNNLGEVTCEGNVSAKLGDNAVRNNVLRLTVLLTANDNTVLTLKGLTYSNLSLCGLGGVLIVGNGNVISLTELNCLVRSADGIFICGESLSVAALIGSDNSNSCIAKSITCINESIADSDRLNCAVIKSLGYANLYVNGLKNVTDLIAYGNLIIGGGKRGLSIYNVFVSRNDLRRAVVIYCLNNHTCSIEGATLRILNGIGSFKNLKSFNNYGNKLYFDGCACALI